MTTPSYPNLHDAHRLYSYLCTNYGPCSTPAHEAIARLSWTVRDARRELGPDYSIENLCAQVLSVIQERARMVRIAALN